MIDAPAPDSAPTHVASTPGAEAAPAAGGAPPTTTGAAPFPQGPIPGHRGRGVAVCGDDIDTDRIIPARFLKCVSFEGLAAGAFADDRRELASHPEGPHPFDRDEHQEASVLVVNRNFGCGSSREHAPQALMRWGIRAVIGESFAEIFFGNCLALGIPCLTASHDDVVALQQAISSDPTVVLEVDVKRRQVRLLAGAATPEPAGGAWRGDPGAATDMATATSGQPLSGMAQVWTLELADGPHRMLLSGQWDGTAQLLAQDDGLRRTAERLPYLRDFLPT